jgi:hypothetical protein
MKKLKSLLNKPFESISREWARMAERERRLFVVFAMTLGLLVVFVGGYLFSSDIADTNSKNDDMRAALKAIARNRIEYLEAKQKMRAMEVRLGDTTPQLATDMEAAAKEVGVQIPETNERTAAPIGRRYLEHNVDVKLRQVDLKQLGKFLYRLETGGHLIYVTRISVRRRFAERDKLDIELTATSIERLKKELPDPAKNVRGRKRT